MQYHLLLETSSGNLSKIMRHINGVYSTYFNVKWKRAGHLFQGRYKAILVNIDIGKHFDIGESGVSQACHKRRTS